jgi:hypothetical protein
MAKEPEPKTLARLKGDTEPEGEGLIKLSQEKQPATVRWTVPEDQRDKLEAEAIIRSLTEREHGLSVAASQRQVIWLLSGLAYFALLIILLLGLGIVTLQTAVVIALIGPLLSGVVGLLTILVKRLH